MRTITRMFFIVLHNFGMFWLFDSCGVFTDKMLIGLDMFSETTGICVPFGASRYLALVWLLHLVSPGMFESITGIRISLIASWNRTDIGLFPTVGP